MTVADSKDFEILNADDAKTFLRRKHTGRIAFSLHDRVDIEPITHTFDGDWILVNEIGGRSARRREGGDGSARERQTH